MPNEMSKFDVNSAFAVKRNTVNGVIKSLGVGTKFCALKSWCACFRGAISLFMVPIYS